MSSHALQIEPDIHSSSDEYAGRFANEIGSWMLDVQERAVLNALPSSCVTVLDVGGGHAQITKPLIKAGKSVTVLGSAPECAARLKEDLDVGLISFKTGSLLKIPFPDKSFDCVVCLRILSHTTNWEALIAELTRVAKHAVIVDYPVWWSVNLLSPLLFRLKKMLEGNTRTFTLFSSFAINSTFKKNRFQEKSRFKQFFFPMALHRALKNVPTSKKLEGTSRTFGLTSFFGSPVIAQFERQ